MWWQRSQRAKLLPPGILNMGAINKSLDLLKMSKYW
jgi:hypothetical protein